MARSLRLQTRSLHFKAKPRSERNDQIFTFELGGQFLPCAIGQAQKKRSCKFEARLSGFEEKKSKLLTPKTFPFPKEGIVFREKKTQGGGVQIDTRIH